MKIKTDFVTNSSSTCYIIQFERLFLRKEFEEHLRLYTGEYFHPFKNQTELVKYTQQDDVDWITEATKKPLRYFGLSQKEFDVCVEIFENGMYPVYMQLDRNYDDRKEKAESFVVSNGGLVRNIESD